MITTDDFYHAEGAEGRRLNNAARRMFKTADELGLSVADMMNLMVNLIAEMAFTECIDRQTLLEVMGKTYDLQVESATKDETIN